MPNHHALQRLEPDLRTVSLSAEFSASLKDRFFGAFHFPRLLRSLAMLALLSHLPEAQAAGIDFPFCLPIFDYLVRTADPKMGEVSSHNYGGPGPSIVVWGDAPAGTRCRALVIWLNNCQHFRFAEA
jgi:hypothetical protein